jgi:hypothetical protein
MSQVQRVKKALEAVVAVPVKATPVEAATAAQGWRGICDDTSATSDLRAIATLRRRELEGALANSDGPAREAALGALSAIAVANLS